MAAATVVKYGGPERNLSLPLSNKVLHRWSLVAGNGDTHDTGLDGIVETAITGTRSSSALAFASGNCAVASVSAGVVTFTAAGSTLFDLLVWSNQ